MFSKNGFGSTYTKNLALNSFLLKAVNNGKVLTLKYVFEIEMNPVLAVLSTATYKLLCMQLLNNILFRQDVREST